jgi:hypothetical protein
MILLAPWGYGWRRRPRWAANRDNQLNEDVGDLNLIGDVLCDVPVETNRLGIAIEGVPYRKKIAVGISAHPQFNLERETG